MDSVPLTIAEQRQIVYSSLLRYAPEAASLRDRALDRVVLGALIGSEERKPIQTTEILNNIHFLKNGPSIRETTVHDALVRLERSGKVGKANVRKRRVFWLTEQGRADVSQAIAGVEPKFEAAFREILQNTAHHFTFAEGAMICRRILMVCFARMGRDLAKAVTEPAGTELHLARPQIVALIGEALRDTLFSAEAKESLANRICEFFRSQSKAAVELKFHLTQGYYLTELLGIDPSSFNPLAEHSFRDSVFYLDANVLLLAVLERGKDESAFGEIARMAKQIGIRLFVTRATLNEVRKAAIEHVGQIRKFLGKLPDVLTERSDDQFLLSFQRASERDPAVTLDMFLGLFLDLDKTVNERWGIEIDERIEDDILGAAQYTDIVAAINAASDAFGTHRKSEAILKHDVCHVVLVQGVRSANRKTWFLTRDGVLARATKELAKTDLSVCFSLVGFLHSISPFVTVADQRPFAEMLSEIMELQLTPEGVLYDVNELAIIAEMHADVLATPPAQLLMAFDFVKMHELNGSPYDIAEYGKVSLGLKKYLTKSRDEQFRCIEAERRRLELENQEVARRAKEAADEAAQGRAAIQGLSGRIEMVEREKADVSAELSALRTSSVPRSHIRAAVLWGGLGVGAIMTQVFRDRLEARWLAFVPKEHLPWVLMLLNLVCLALALTGAMAQIRILARTAWSRRLAVVGMVFFSVGWLTFFHQADAERLIQITELTLGVLPALYFLWRAFQSPGKTFETEE